MQLVSLVVHEVEMLSKCFLSQLNHCHYHFSHQSVNISAWHLCGLKPLRWMRQLTRVHQIQCTPYSTDMIIFQKFFTVVLWWILAFSFLKFFLHETFNNSPHLLALCPLPAPQGLVVLCYLLPCTDLHFIIKALNHSSLFTHFETPLWGPWEQQRAV